MASVKPVVSNSQALITPGYPLAAVQQSHPQAVQELAASVTQLPHVSVTRTAAVIASGHHSDRVD